MLRADGLSRPAQAVQWSGVTYLIFGTVIFFAPDFTASLLRLGLLVPQGQHYFRLVGMLVTGLGILYVVSGRLDSREFAFASLLDRPLVPLVMLVLWRRQILPGPLALAFSISDFGGFLVTLIAWRAEQRAGGAGGGRQ